MENYRTEIEKAFYSDGYKLGMQVDEKVHIPKGCNEAVEKIYANIDGLTESLSELARQNRQSIDCKRGCEWCCHQPVFALDYELEYLRDYINTYFDQKMLREVRRRTENKQMKFKGLKGDDLLNAKHPCPLLNQGACMAYEARPMACRIYLSSDLQTCKKFYDSPEDQTNYPALLELPMKLGRMMNEGFKAALKTKGRIVKEYRIEEKLFEKS